MSVEYIENFVLLKGDFLNLQDDFVPFRFDYEGPQVTLRLAHIENAIRSLSVQELAMWCANIEACECLKYEDEHSKMIEYLVSELAPPSYQF